MLYKGFKIIKTVKAVVVFDWTMAISCCKTIEEAILLIDQINSKIIDFDF